MLANESAPVGAIEQKIREFVEDKLSYDGSVYVTRASPLLSGLLTSLQLIKLVVFVEGTFGFTIRIGELAPENLKRSS